MEKIRISLPDSRLPSSLPMIGYRWLLVPSSPQSFRFSDPLTKSWSHSTAAVFLKASQAGRLEDRGVPLPATALHSVLSAQNLGSQASQLLAIQQMFDCLPCFRNGAKTKRD